MQTEQATLAGRGARADARGKPASLARRPFMIALFISVFGLLSTNDGATGAGSGAKELFWLLLGGAVLPGLMQFDRRLRLNLLRCSATLVLSLLLAYCLLSAIWSEAPWVSLRRAALLCVVVLICGATFARDEVAPQNFVRLCSWPLCLLLLLSYLAVGLWPDLAAGPDGWRGVTAYKNGFGQLCALALLCCADEYWRKQRLEWLALLGLAAAGLLLSRSMSCIVAAGVAMPLSVVLLISRTLLARRSTQAWFYGPLLLLAFMLYLLYASGSIPDFDTLTTGVFKLMGKSQTLSGRTELWNVVFKNFRYHSPWLGGGFGAFWNGLDSAAGYTAWQFSGGYLGQAHNGYIDLYNDIGILGMALFAMLLLCQIHGLMLLWRSAHSEFYFHFCFLIMVLLLSYSESFLLRGTHAWNILFLASYLRVAALVRQAPRARLTPAKEI